MNFKINYKKFLFVTILTAAAVIFSGLRIALPKAAYAYGNGGGRYLFNYYNCLDCHMIKGIGGTLGPALSNYGSKNKSYGWTAAQIKNPQSHYKKPGSKIVVNGKTYYAVMPSYNYIPSADLEKIISYLNSLKK